MKYPGYGREEMSNIEHSAEDVQQHLDAAHEQRLPLLSDAGRRDAGATTNFVIYTQRLNDKLVNCSKTSNANIQA